MRGSSTDLIDRVATLAVGLAVAAVGAAGILWPTHLGPDLPDEVSSAPLLRISSAEWWPWALGGAGAVLAVCALVWLVAHVPTRKAQTLRVRDAGDNGVITVNLGGVASAAAAALAQDRNIVAAKGKALSDRGVPTIELTVTIAHPDSLGEVVSAVDATSARIADVTGGSQVAARTILQVGKLDGQRRNLE